MNAPTSDNHWHLDKRVNISHIVATILLLVGGFSVVQRLDSRITANEVRIEAIQQQTLEYQRRAIDQMNRIEDKIDRVIERQNTAR